jgi:hypothetical protein
VFIAFRGLLIYLEQFLASSAVLLIMLPVVLPCPHPDVWDTTASPQRYPINLVQGMNDRRAAKDAWCQVHVSDELPVILHDFQHALRGECRPSLWPAIKIAE